MKKNYIIASAFLMLGAMVGGLTSCTNNQQGGATSITVSMPDSARLPVAYVNVDSLLTNYDFAKDLNEELIKKTEDARANLNGQAQSLEKEFNEFQRKLQTNAFLSQDRAEAEANRLQKKKDNLDKLNYDLQQNLAMEQAQMNARLSDSIRNYIKEYNEVAKFELIFTNTMYDNLIIDSPKYDITGEILNNLNSRYASNKAN